MEQQFSPGLLYSIAPENISNLHLLEDDEADVLEWEEPETLLETAKCLIHTLLAKHEGQ
jgi:hypothetical protein